MYLITKTLNKFNAFTCHKNHDKHYKIPKQSLCDGIAVQISVSKDTEKVQEILS